MEQKKQIQEKNQIPQASFEDLCPDFDFKIKKEGYETTKSQKFMGQSGAKRALCNAECCIVGEAFDLRG